jgi:uncharacterized protein with PIN domain
MLGRSTRWLRLLGNDVEYKNDANDDELLERARVENKTLLTRDTALYRRAAYQGIEAFIVEGKSEPEKLANVARRFDLKLEFDSRLSRCPTCNSTLRTASREEVASMIPKSTLEGYREFWRCKGCGKVYWQGGHWRKINTILSEARSLLEAKGS